MDTTEKSPVILSLCTGVRGLERGIERALGRELRTAAYVEIEAFIIANLIAGMEAGVLAPAPVWSNLKTFPYKEFHGKVHGIIGGYPCQPFSNAGRRKGEEDPRHLWPYIAEGIRAIRPLWCFFENVSGHLTLGYETVRGELQDMGYRVTEGIFTAEEVGAPHRRERLFILALLGDPKSLYAQGCFGGQEQGKFRGAGDESNELAFSNGIRCFHREFVFNTTKGRFNAQCNVTACGNENVANMCSEGLQRVWKCNRQEGWKNENGHIGSCGDLWPSRPGEPQYEWEEKRTIKSGMGFTINGYNFREDLLRAYGNGVVEQTAELAWITLWNKINN